MDMSMIVISAAIIGGAIFLMNENKEEKEDNNKHIDKYKYKTKSLMTDNEWEFFNRLVQALPEYYVFPQVAMAAILNPDTDDRKENNIIRNTFNRKMIDYIVFKDKKIIAIIELDDKTHVQEKDEKRDEMTKQAGYKTIRFQSKNKPSIEQIRESIIKK